MLAKGLTIYTMNNSIRSIESQISHFIQQNAPAGGVVLGVSGGIDSAVVLTLCVKALGKNRTRALFMPEVAKDISDTIQTYVQDLGVRVETIPIKPLFDVYIEYGGVAKKDRVVSGNLKARIRMSLLYSRSNAQNLVVMGTGNRSELLVGYFTRYGDGGVDFLPIGALYKTQVFALARQIGVPEEIVTQAPSAGLWAGQTDEQELGITYEKLDRILIEYADKNIPFSQIKLPGITSAEVQIVRTRVESSRYKLQTSPICQMKQ